MKVKLFRTKAELVTLFVIAISVSWVFTPIVEHIYESTDWSKFSITEITDRVEEYREDLRNEKNVD